MGCTELMLLLGLYLANPGIDIVYNDISKNKPEPTTVIEDNAKPAKIDMEKTESVSSGELEDTIRGCIKDLREKGYISSDENTSWVVYDLAAEEELVSINGNIPMQAASMIKPLVMLAYFQEVEEGKIEYIPEDKKELEKMIQKSNNNSANYFIKKLGGPQAVEKILKEHYWDILRDISVVEYIPKSGETYKNKASARDYSRFLYALWNNKLPYSDDMKRIMALPGRDRICTKANGIPANSTYVYDKTGSTARLCGDMGIVVAKDRYGNGVPYIFIGVVEKQKKAKYYNKWISHRANVMREVSALVYTYMAKKHNLARQQHYSKRHKL